MGYNLIILFIGEFYMKTQTTIRVDESSYIQAKEILNLAQEIIDKNWSLYQEQIKVENKDELKFLMTAGERMKRKLN